MLRTKMTKGGKIAIPSAYRKKLNIKTGDDIIFELNNDKLVMTSLKATLEQSRQLVQKYLDQSKTTNLKIDKMIDNHLTEDNDA